MSGSLNLILAAGGLIQTYSVNTTANVVAANSSYIGYQYMNEGDARDFRISTNNVPSSQALYWEAVWANGDIISNTIFTTTSGAFTRGTGANPSTFTTLTAVKDSLKAADGDRSFYVRVKSGNNASGPVVATSNTIILFDTTGSHLAVGQVEYTTPGTYTFVAPQTTTYAVVCVGGGGGGAVGDGGDGGGGGALSYVNGISLTAGQSYTVVVGAGGTGALGVAANGMVGNSTNLFANGGIAGGNSYFINATACFAGGGAPGNTAANGRGVGGTGVVSSTFGTSRATFAGGPGGYGTATDGWEGPSGLVDITAFGEYLPDSGAGGGAAGYAGVGGSGAANTATANCSAGSAGAGGGGGGGTSNPDGGGGGGGGVGLQGQGNNGVFNYWYDSNIYWNLIATGGGGGSGGSDAPWADSTGGAGGLYGGGGGGTEYMGWIDSTILGTYIGLSGGTGANGAVRIIWGSGRAFPSTDTADKLVLQGTG